MSPFWRRRRREAELDEEIAGHLAMAARDREAAGQSLEEARYAARREFGNRTLVKELTRQMWGWTWAEQWWWDVRLAWRSLRRAPAFTVVAVLALGLGLGLSTTMFAVMDAVRHPHSPYANGDRIYMLNIRYSVRAGQIVTPDALNRMLKERVPALDAIVSFSGTEEPVLFGQQPVQQLVMIVPPEFFDVMGIGPEVGRVFTPSDGDGAVMVSHEVWKRALGGRRDLGGAHLAMGDRTYGVVGVLPRVTMGPGVYRPLLPSEEGTVSSMPIVRLKRGVPQQEADRELAALARQLTVEYASPDAPWGLKLMRWLDVRRRVDQLSDVQVAMVGSALAVLLIACVNLAHLMLARGLDKRRELALRMALGAGRTAAIRSMLAEVALVAVAGLALGALVATWGSRLLDTAMPYDLSWWGVMRAQLSWRVFALAALAALASAALFGLVPAIRVAFDVHITDPLKDEGGTTTGRPRRYSALAIGEVALALALLMSGGLLLRSVHQLRSAPTGFDAETLLQANLAGRFEYRAAAGGRRDTIIRIDWGQVVAAARGVPGVAGAALQTWARAAGGALTAEMGADTTRTINTQEYPVVSPDYLAVHGLRILQGRDFEPGDVSGDGVMILSAAAAARLYPHGNAIGRMVKVGSPTAKAPWLRVVGVARTPLEPWTAVPRQGGDMPIWAVGPLGKPWRATLLIRTAGRDPSVTMRLWHTLHSLPGVQGSSIEPFTRMRDATLASFNFFARVFVGMGLLGLGLAALGLYGVLRYTVARRLREFAVRIALGAEPRVLFRTVMRDGLVMLLAGTGLGAFVALSAAYLFNSMLIGVYPTDALSLVAAEALLLTVGLAATAAPALRAMRADPAEILRAT